jgi:hypothetical protein
MKKEVVNAVSVQRFGGGGSGEKVSVAGAMSSIAYIGVVTFGRGATCTVTGRAVTQQSEHGVGAGSSLRWWSCILEEQALAARGTKAIARMAIVKRPSNRR